MNEHVKSADPKDDRRDRLTEFANVPAATRNNSIVPAQFGMPAERVFGAVDVAVHRDEARILQKLKALAAAAGDDWFYRFPVKTKGGGKSFVEGPSIKLANDVARIYGNCDIDCRAQDLGDSWLFLARFTDFETGYTLTRPFQQRKAQKSLKTDDDGRAQDIAFQIGASKAIRNVVANALQTFADFAFEEAKNSLVQKIGGELPKWRDRVLEGIKNMGVEVERVVLVIGRPPKDWLAPDVAKIIAMMKAVADGMATADETFPKPGAKEADDETPSNEASEQDRGKLDEFAGNGNGNGQGGQAAQGQAGQEAAQTANEQPATETKGGDKPAANEAPKDAPLPKTEAEWTVYATSWIENGTDAAALTQRWKDEKNLRNKANVSEEAREAVKAKLDDKVKTLKGG